MTIRSIEDASGMHCVDVISLSDGCFSFKLFRKDPEDQGRWTLVADYSGLRFDTEGQALREAAAITPWLAELLGNAPADGNRRV